MDGGVTVDWAALPPELYTLIADHLKTHLEILRFRSVCTTWRSSIPPFAAPIPIKFPFPDSDGSPAFLTEITAYILRPDPGSNPNPNPDPSTSSPKGFLLKVEELKGKLSLLNPITSFPIGHRNADVRVNPTDLNFLDYQMVELRKGHALRYRNGSGPIFGINKVIVAPKFETPSIFIICNQGKLGFGQNEGRDLTTICSQLASCDDIIAYKDRPYVVDNLGTLFRIDSSLKSLPFSPSVGSGHKKNLIESCGELYVVDRHLSDISQEEVPSDYGFFLPSHGRRRRRCYDAHQPKATDFEVYKLDEELGRWDEVKSLGDQAFFLGVDCSFSVVASEIEGCKGNAIYFTDSNDIGLALRGLTRPHGSVFSLEDHSIERLGASSVYSKMFWPLRCG